jgi:hypothetical protein
MSYSFFKHTIGYQHISLSCRCLLSTLLTCKYEPILRVLLFQRKKIWIHFHMLTRVICSRVSGTWKWDKPIKNKKQNTDERGFSVQTELVFRNFFSPNCYLSLTIFSFFLITPQHPSLFGVGGGSNTVEKRSFK